MRTKQVAINGKEFVVKEKRNKELDALVQQFKNELVELEIGNNFHQAFLNIMSFIDSKLLILFPEITQEDIDDGYPSEKEALVEAFIEVNFTGLRRVVTSLASIVDNLLKAASLMRK